MVLKLHLIFSHAKKLFITKRRNFNIKVSFLILFASKKSKPFNECLALKKYKKGTHEIFNISNKFLIDFALGRNFLTKVLLIKTSAY